MKMKFKFKETVVAVQASLVRMCTDTLNMKVWLFFLILWDLIHTISIWVGREKAIKTLNLQCEFVLSSLRENHEWYYCLPMAFSCA